MPDIQLKTFKKASRSNTGYTKLDSGDIDNGDTGEDPEHTKSGRDREDRVDRNTKANSNTMASSSRSVGASFRGKKPTRKLSYHYDDREEEENLLTGHEREDDYERNAVSRRRKEASISARSVSLASLDESFMNETY
jgi:hypothetical protein